MCDDGLDNDGDNLADCLDVDCDQLRCRVTVGFCDAEEVCTNGVCPADEVLAQGTVCRAGDSCDIEEKCDGVSHHCPVDQLAGSNLICRAPAGPCDHAETCDGTSPKCPDDVVELPGTVCRPGAGVCDEPEVCDGVSNTCPVDAWVPASAAKVCRAAAGVCDTEETCDGTSVDCPTDIFLGPGSPTCRPSGGACDVAEACDGSSADCPVDINGCNANEYCDNGSCQPQKTQGVSCGGDMECLSGFCADGVCCDGPCTGACRSCVTSGKVGTCTNHASGTDPEQGCGKYVCNGSGACYDDCLAGSLAEPGEGYCNPDYFCAYGTCDYLKYPNGTGCKKGFAFMCQSGECWRELGQEHGFCCDPGCDRCCGDCSSGTCTPEPAGTDASACSHYVCNGSGGYKDTCTADGYNCSADCSADAWCWEEKCGPDLGPGAACLGACQCASNVCFPFVCW